MSSHPGPPIPSGSAGPVLRSRLFGSLCGMVFLVNFGRVTFAPLLEPLMRTFDLGEATAGLVVTLVWLGSALPRLPTGYLLTRVSRARVVLVAGGLLAAAATFTAVAPDVALLGLGAFLVGTASGVYFVAANPLVSELFPERVGRALGVHSMAAQSAAVVAPVVVVVVLAVGDWWWVFAGLGVAAVAVAASFGVATRAGDLPTAGSRDRHLLRAARREWPTVATGVVVVGALGFVWNGAFNFYVPYLTTTKAVPVGTANLLLTVLFAAGVPSMWLAGRLADRYSHVGLVLAILAGFVASLYGLTLASGLVAIAVVTVVLGTVVHAMFVSADTYLLSAFPDERRASAYATYSAVVMVFNATGSVVLGTLVEAGVTYDAAFRTAVVGVALVTVGMLALHRAGRLPTGASAA